MEVIIQGKIIKRGNSIFDVPYILVQFEETVVFCYIQELNKKLQKVLKKNRYVKLLVKLYGTSEGPFADAIQLLGINTIPLFE